MAQQETPVEQVFEFWFSAPNSKEYGKPRSFWFNLNPNIDLAIQQNFFQLYCNAKNETLNNLKETPEGMLALIILLDQIPRHIFRGTKDAFETDAQAVALAKASIFKGFDQILPHFMRLFFYLPLEHSEDLGDQAQSVRLFEALDDPGYLKYAQEHFNVIKQFGRFPHRNMALNRTNTEEENLFLQRAS